MDFALKTLASVLFGCAVGMVAAQYVEPWQTAGTIGALAATLLITIQTARV